MVKYTSDVTLYRAGEGKKNQMIKKDNTSKQIRIYCLVVGIISLLYSIRLWTAAQQEYCK